LDVVSLSTSQLLLGISTVQFYSISSPAEVRCNTLTRDAAILQENESPNQSLNFVSQAQANL
jgi:hypothetical protein